MRAFFVGLTFLIVVSTLIGMGILLFPLVIALGILLRTIFVLLFVIFAIWLLGRFIIFVWGKLKT